MASLTFFQTPKATTCAQPHVELLETAGHDVITRNCDTVPDFNGTKAHRVLFEVATGSSAFLVETTDSAMRNNDHRLVHVPGLSENVCHPFARDRLSMLYSSLPVARAIALGHNGIGLAQYSDYETRREVANTRLKLLKATAKSREKHILIGSSMGSIVVADMIELNGLSKKPIDIGGVVLFGPALNTNKDHVRERARSFAKQLLLDGSRDIATRSPLELVSNVSSLVSWGRETVRARRHIMHQLGEIITASQFELINEFAGNTPTVAVYGDRDEIVEDETWEHMQAAHPATFNRMVLKGIGHEILDNPKLAAKVLREAILQTCMLTRS